VTPLRCQVCESDETITARSPMRHICRTCIGKITAAIVNRGGGPPKPSDVDDIRAGLKVQTGVPINA
jgi:hypothetical protein